MGPFSSIIRSLAEAETIKDQTARQALHEMSSLIKDQEEIRFFVDGTHHFGHQAASVNLMKRLIDWTGFAGRIRVIYAEASTVPPGSTANKLAVLLPGLDPRRINTTAIMFGTCKNITFLPYEERESLIDDATIGFTGGADDMSINLAAELKVKYFLRLQPYLWDDDTSRKANLHYESSRIETPSNQYFYMVDEHPGFRHLPIKFPKTCCSHVPNEVWTWYGTTQDFDTDLKIRTKNAKSIYQTFRQNKDLHLWPLYGLHQFREQIAEMAMHIVFTAFLAQQTIQKPIVVFCMNKPKDIPHFQNLLVPFARDLTEGDCDLNYFKSSLTEHYVQELRTSHDYSTERLNSFVDEMAEHVRPLIKKASTLTFLTDYDPATNSYIDISESLNRAISTARENEVVVALIGPIPGDIYNYFYGNSTFPGLFEGQATSSLVVSLGRPFLQIHREDSAIEDNYPSSIGRKDYTQISSTVKNAALQLRAQRYSQYILGPTPKEPGQYFSQLGNIANFILELQDPSSQMSSYFSALGEYYQQDIHDKFVLGLIALLTAPL
jgi:hypothetical protein